MINKPEDSTLLHTLRELYVETNNNKTEEYKANVVDVKNALSKVLVKIVTGKKKSVDLSFSSILGGSVEEAVNDINNEINYNLFSVISGRMIKVHASQTRVSDFLSKLP